MDPQISADTAHQKFFISYAHSDDPSVALRTYLTKELRQHGHDVFSDQSIEGSQEWGEQLTKHAEECDCFVVLISDGALASRWVRAEVKRVCARFERERKPAIFVVRLSNKEFDVVWDADLGRFQDVKWTSPAHSPVVRDVILGRITAAEAEAKIEKAAAARKLRKRIGVSFSVALPLAALVAYIFVIAPFTNIQKLRAASQATDSAAGNVIPLSEAKKYRDAASRVGWSSRADAAYKPYLDRWSDGLLAKARKSIDLGKVQEGLVLAALVAQENGGKLDPSFLKDYEEGNYASLKKTLRTGSPLSAGLAVSSDGTQIAAGHTLWNLAASTRCSLAGAINAVAFGPRGLYTGGNEEVTQWTSCQPGRQIPVSDERVQDLAVAQDGTVAVVVHKGNDVLLYKGVTELSLPHAEQVRSVAFSDDGAFLVTTSGKLLSVWNGAVSNPPPPPNKIDTGLSLRGAALNGDYVAVNGAQKVRIWRLRPKVQFVREVALLAPVRSIALSEDAVQLAMVSEEGVFSDRVARVASRRIGARQSVASDVIFLDVRRQLIVKRADAVEIWDPEPSSADADVPEHRLARWMDKFALNVDENGRVTPRVWNESR